jgi:CRP-like cAMP-binding protein
MSLLEILRRNPVLAQGEHRVLSRVAASSEVVVYDSGTVVAMLQSAVTHVLMVAGGLLELYRRNREAETQMLIGVIAPPAILGDAELYGRSTWVMTVRAAEQSTIVRIPIAAFDRMVSSDPKIAAGLYRETCARHLLAVELMQVFALQKTQNKILRLLATIALQDNHDRRAARISQVQLADALGLNVKTIRRHLADLEASSLIQRERDQILLLGDSHNWSNLSRGFGASWKLVSAGKPRR